MQTTEEWAAAAALSVEDVDPAGWQAELDGVMARVGGWFARREPRLRARAFVAGLLAPLRRKNCWTIAEQAGQVDPQGMQRLLSSAVWDDAGVRSDLRDWVAQAAELVKFFV